MREKIHSYAASGAANYCSHSGKKKKKKLGMDPLIDPAIPLLGLYPKDLKSHTTEIQPHQ